MAGGISRSVHRARAEHLRPTRRRRSADRAVWRRCIGKDGACGVTPRSASSRRVWPTITRSFGEKKLKGCAYFRRTRQRTDSARIAALWSPSITGQTTRQQLRDLGCRYVAPFAALFWKYADVFIPGNGIDLPHNLPACADELRAVYGMLADEHSRREMCAQLRWRYWLDDSGMPAPLAGARPLFPARVDRPIRS